MEYERIIKEALLTDEEIEEAKDKAEKQIWRHGVHPMYEREKVLLQAQLDKFLKTDGIEIRAENQDLPLVVNDSKDFNNAYRDIGEGYAQKYMLTPDSEGKVWRKVIPKGR